MLPFKPVLYLHMPWAAWRALPTVLFLAILAILGDRYLHSPISQTRTVRLIETELLLFGWVIQPVCGKADTNSQLLLPTTPGFIQNSTAT